MHKNPKAGQSLKDLYPEICKDWSINNQINPEHYCYSSNKKVEWKCLKCSYIWISTINHRTCMKSGCPNCGIEKKKKRFKPKNKQSLKDKFPDLCNEWSDKNENPPETYCYGSKFNAYWKCRFCKNIWCATINSRTNAKSNCPKCSKSKGELAIEELLVKEKINYKSQYKFDNCKTKRTLPFDFAILDQNNNLLGLIEYNGSQHYDIKFSEEQFKRTQITDKIKQDYCKENNIPLLIIKYTEFKNIEMILKNWLNDKNY